MADATFVANWSLRSKKSGEKFDFSEKGCNFAD